MRVFQWTEDEDDIALDAVTVGISSDSRILTIAGLQFGQRNAIVFWPDWVGRGKPVSAAIEGPMSVQDAFERAAVVCDLHAFKRVVVWLQHRELWDDRWGQLSPIPGL